jgi:sec-independent protein translocase protein TatC
VSDGDHKKPDAEDEGMTIWEHLEELRSRLIRMLLAFLAGSIAAWTQKEHLLLLLTKPFVDAWNQGQHAEGAAIHFPAPAALFIAYIRLSVMAGFVVAMPFILWQLWAFIAPGLYSKEKRLAVPFVGSSCLLFGTGVYFAWRIVAPAAFNFFLNLSPGQLGDLSVKPNIMISEYIEFVTHLLVAFGVVTELPIVIFFLTISGIVTPRQLIKFFRYFLVVDFIVAAVITPPDVLSQLMLAIPLAFLYLFSVGIAWLFVRRKPQGPPEGTATS